jgi:Amt family ammonium transporter
MMQSFVLMIIGTIMWALIGYSLSFGEGNSFIRRPSLRTDGRSGDGSANGLCGNHSALTWMAFPMMFAIITPALITGAFAERMKFSAMCLFTILWSFVYYPLAHMVWGKGGIFNAFLGGSIPAYDFAGGTVVHISSGVPLWSALFIMGKRKGYGTNR